MIQITNPKRFYGVIAILILVTSVVPWIFGGSGTVQKSGEIEIIAGSSAKSVWNKLEGEGYTGSALPWRYHGWRQDAADKLKAGTYALEKGEKIPDVVGRFVAGDVNPDEFTITFPEGFTLEQMAERVAARGIGTKEEFLAAAQPGNFTQDFPLLENIPEERNLEGYLFPDTYRLAEGDSAANVIERLVANFHRRFSPDMREEVKKSERSLDQIVIMSSIIEREVLTDDDMAVVSGILWKRVDDEVGLDADATVRYALKKWDGPLTVQDLANESPYNTRKWRGLPPGPISNPGLRALQAALNPQPSDYYYYLSAPDGKTIFSKTNDEHNENKIKYLK